MTIMVAVDVVATIMDYQEDYFVGMTQKYYFSQQYSYYYSQVLDVAQGKFQPMGTVFIGRKNKLKTYFDEIKQIRSIHKLPIERKLKKWYNKSIRIDKNPLN